MSLVLFFDLAFANDVRVAADLPDLNAQVLRPSLSSERLTFTAESATFEDGFFGAVMTEYTDNPIIYRWHSGATEELIDLLVQSSVFFGYTYSGYQMTLGIPVFLQSTGLAGQEQGLGDVQLGVKKAFTDASFDAVGTAVQLGLEFPTATTKAPLGNSGVAWDFNLILDKDFGPTKRCGFRSFCNQFRGALNIGHAGIPEDNLENLVWGSRFFVRGGLGVLLSKRWGMGFEGSFHMVYTDRKNTAGRPLELTTVVFGDLGDHWRVRLSGGKGMSEGIGSPALRTLIMFTYAPESW